MMLDDLPAFLSDFAEVGTLSSGVSIRGVFNNGYADQLQMAGTEPIFTGRTSDMTGIASGTAISIGGTAYTVTGNEADGTGVSMLVLRRA
jgi:hypothetical protein